MHLRELEESFSFHSSRRFAVRRSLIRRCCLGLLWLGVRLSNHLEFFQVYGKDLIHFNRLIRLCNDWKQGSHHLVLQFQCLPYLWILQQCLIFDNFASGFHQPFIDSRFIDTFAHRWKFNFCRHNTPPLISGKIN